MRRTQLRPALQDRRPTRRPQDPQRGTDRHVEQRERVAGDDDRAPHHESGPAGRPDGHGNAADARDVDAPADGGQQTRRRQQPAHAHERRPQRDQRDRGNPQAPWRRVAGTEGGHEEGHHPRDCGRGAAGERQVERQPGRHRRGAGGTGEPRGRGDQQESRRDHDGGDDHPPVVGTPGSGSQGNGAPRIARQPWQAGSDRMLGGRVALIIRATCHLPKHILSC